MDPLSLGLGAVGSLVSGLFGMNSKNKDYEHDFEMMQKQHEYQLEMLNATTDAQKNLFQYQFDANNEYNDPKNAYARLVNAGLNPNLMYSQGAGAAGVASGSMPNVNSSSAVGTPNSGAASRAASNLGEAWQNFISAKNLALQSRKVESEARKTDQERLTEIEKTIAEHIDNMTRAKKNGLDIRYYREQIKNLQKEREEINMRIGKGEAETRKTNAEAALAEVNKQIAEIEVKYAPVIKAAQVANLNASSRAFNAQAFASSEQGKLFRAQADKEGLNASILRKTYDEQVELIVQKAEQQGLINAKTSAETTKILQDSLEKFLSNKISLGTFQLQVYQAMVSCGYNAGPSQAADFLKSLAFGAAALSKY